MNDGLGRASRFRINYPAVVHETLDGELIVVNLDTGKYFSIDAVGADIWRLVGAGTSITSVVDALRRDYASVDGELAATVSDFVRRLHDEALIVPEPGDAPSAPPVSEATTPGRAERAFRPPTLRVYTDMQDLLMLDPIHDVDETGWPIPQRRRPDSRE